MRNDETNIGVALCRSGRGSAGSAGGHSAERSCATGVPFTPALHDRHIYRAVSYIFPITLKYFWSDVASVASVRVDESPPPVCCSARAQRARARARERERERERDPVCCSARAWGGLSPRGSVRNMNGLGRGCKAACNFDSSVFWTGDS
jgi:hypothetical protein